MRFANVIQLNSNSSMEDIWKLVKNIKSKLSFEKGCTYDGLYYCYDYENEIRPQVDELQKALLTVNAFDIRYQNVSRETLKAASKMFLYINSCSMSMKPWFLFYKDLFQNHSPDQIMLTLNRIMKSNRNKKLISITKKLFKKINSLLSLKYLDIENVIKGHEEANLRLDGNKSMLIFDLILLLLFCLDSNLASVNHPIHIIDKYYQKNPSAFIPFCEFGGNMSIMGVNIDQFDIPVCTSFKATILNDQLCYEVDLNRFSNHKDMKSNLESGFIFLMDYNEDRQVAIYNESSKLEEKSFANRVVKSDHENHASIILNTIGAAAYILVINFLKLL